MATITVESLRRRIEKLRKAESDALATAHANAGAVALCEELIRGLEEDAGVSVDIDDLDIDRGERCIHGVLIRRTRCLNCSPAVRLDGPASDLTTDDLRQIPGVESVDEPESFDPAHTERFG